MKILEAKNVNYALPLGIKHLMDVGEFESSRNGKVLVAPHPVTTVYSCPEERVLFNEQRDANPFFHLHEALWMLGGRRDVASVARYVTRMREYSDDGLTLHGAYGYRWRHWFGHDQLELLIETLLRNPKDRRAVLSMWTPDADLAHESRDIPCNTHAYFRVLDNQLHMTVCCRSNDVIWGAYGANAVHFSILQEYLAHALGRDLGAYYQVSNNYHVYVEVMDDLASSPGWDTVNDEYRESVCRTRVINTRVGSWDQEVQLYLDGETKGYLDPFFNETAVPLALAYREHKSGDTDAAIQRLSSEDVYSDWIAAAIRWLERRREKKRKKL